MTTEEAIKKTLSDIEEMQAVNAALPAIKKVISSFDGKVMNKRLEAALQAADLPGRIYIYNRDNSWEVHYHPEKSNNWYTVLWGGKPTCKYYHQESSFVDPDKRINARRAFELIETGRVERLQKITAYRDHLDNYEVKKAQIELLKKQLKAIADTIPYTMQDYFNMRVKYY